MTTFIQLRSLCRLCSVSLIVALLWGLCPRAFAAAPKPLRPGPVNGQNYVFHDNNLNGIYDAGDTGIGGVPVYLYREPDGLLLETVTTATGTGLFSFTTVGQASVAYSFRIKAADAPAGLKLATANVGNDDVNDSDAFLRGSTAVIDAQYTASGFSGNYSFGYTAADPDMTLTKTSDSFSVTRGGQATFTISVSNVGGSTATGVVVRDTLALGMSLVSASPTATTTTLGSGQVELAWTLGNVTAGTGSTYTVRVQANGDGVLTNVAGVTATSPDATPRNNQGRAAFSVPIKLCPGESYVANLTNDQSNIAWFRNGVQVATSSSYTITSSGSYNYTATTANTDCQPGGCLPLIIYDGGVPDLSITPSTTAICAGTSAVLTANNCTNGTIAWSTGSTASTITVTPPVGNNVYSFTCTPTSASACPASASATVTVNPSVTATMTSATICDGTTATLLASGGTSYLFSNGTSNATGELVVSPRTTTIYSVTVTNGNGCSAITSGTVTVNPAVTATMTSSTICDGTSTTLIASGGSGYRFSDGTSNTTGILAVSPRTTTIYSVTVTNTFGCSAITSGTVTVNPAVTAVMTNTTICNGTSGTLVATGGSNYVFSDGTSNATGILVVSPSVTTTYSVTVSNSFGCSAITTGTVTVNPSVTATLTSATICDGTTATLLASGGTSYLFSNGTSNATGELVVSPRTTTIYSVTVTNGNGCSAITSGTVTVNPAVTATMTSSTICDGTSTTLIASGGSGYRFSDGTSNTTGILAVSPRTTTIYSVTVTNTFGCSAITSGTVTVNPAVTATVTQSQTICEGNTVTLTARGGTSYSWSTNETTASISVAPVTTTTYSVTVTNAFGCSAVTSTRVTVNPTPVLSVNSTTICVGASTILSLSGCAGTVVWSTGTTGATLEVSPLATATYSATCTLGTGCTATTTATVTVSPTPSVASQDVVVTRATCNGATPNNNARVVLSNLQNTVRATISAANGSPAAGDVSVTVSSGSITFSNLPNPGQRVTYTIRLFGPTGCTSDVAVTLDPAECACPAAKCVPIVVQKVR